MDAPVTTRRSSLATVLALAATGLAQDSVQKTPCSAGDAVAPWSDAATPTGSEQCDDYVVDMDVVQGSWGTRFGVAPILKASNAAGPELNATMLAQGISRGTRTGESLGGRTFADWSAPGFGVNNDPALNDPGTAVTTACAVSQLGVGFAETGPIFLGESYEAVIGGRVRFVPGVPSRLYVERRVSALNSCQSLGSTARFAFGAADADGHVVFAAGSPGIGTACPGAQPLAGSHVFCVDDAARDCGERNVVSRDYPGELFDAGATTEMLHDATTLQLAPAVVSADAIGQGCFFIGADAAGQVVFGGSAPRVTTLAHLAPGVLAQHGNVSYSEDDGCLLNGVSGLAAVVGESASGRADVVNVWGLGAGGGVTGSLALPLPASVTDPDDGFTTLAPAGELELDHHAPAVAGRGGNGPVALGTDADGHLLVAACAEHPTGGGPTWGVQVIPVARVRRDTGDVTWTVAAWNDGVTGKAVKDGRGGAVVGHLAFNPTGVSISAPGLDEAGNVYFLSYYELDAAPGPRVGLFRAVLDADDLRYELELLLGEGDELRGHDSGRDYRVERLTLAADDGSISPGAFWSQNVSDGAFAGGDSTGLDAADLRHLGGLVLSARILYDRDDDGVYDPCPALGGGGADEPYEVLLFVGHADQEDVGSGKAAAGGVTPRLAVTGPNTDLASTTMALSHLPPGETAYLVLGLSRVDAPFKLGTLVPAPDVVLPGLPTGAGELELTFPWFSGLPPGSALYWQAWITGPGTAGQFSATNGVCSKTP